MLTRFSFIKSATDLGCVLILTSIILLEVIKKVYVLFKNFQSKKYGSILPRYSDESKVLEKKLAKQSIKHATTYSGNKKSNKMDMTQINTYDMFKLVSTITMFVDHYGYYGLPGLTWEQRGWARIVGRFAAPGFFFLAGYASKRFRIRTWMTAFFLYFFTSIAPLGIVHSPWESIINIALINCLYELLPPHKLLACHKNVSIYITFIIHAVLFGMLISIRDYCSKELMIGYGTLPFILAIAGDLHRHQHRFAKMWIVAAMIAFFHTSNTVFANNMAQTLGIAVACCLNAVIMMAFKVQSIPGMDTNFILSSAQNGIKWISREGLTVYVGHLMLYRLIASMQFTWKSEYL